MQRAPRQHAVALRHRLVEREHGAAPVGGGAARLGGPPILVGCLSPLLPPLLGGALAVVGLNLLCLPLYLILMFVPPFNLVLYYLLNGYLYGREYFELVAHRRMDPMAARSMRQRNRGKVLFAGILLTFLLTIPIINFLTSVIATAFMVHVFHGLPGRKDVITT